MSQIDQDVKQVLRMAGWVVAGMVAFILFWGSWYTVAPGHKAVQTRMGSIVGVVDNGIHFKFPVVDSVYDMSLRADMAEVKRAEGGTHDLQPVHVGLVVRYSILPNQVQHIFTQYSRDGEMDSYVMTATAEVFKAVTSRYTAPELIQKRSEVSQAVFSSLQAKVNQYGLKVENIDMTDFTFEKAYMEAVNAKVREEQNMATQANVLKRIEIEQQQKVVSAKAEAESLQAKATAEAFQVTAMAKAKAEALNLEGRALRENSNVAELRRIEVEMRKAESWDGKLPQNMYSNAPVPFFNMGAK